MKVEELMNRYYQDLNENDRLICQYIIKNKETCFRQSIDEFADSCHISKTVLFRFARKLSLPGFSELKARLRWEAEDELTPCADLMSVVAESYHKMIDTMERADYKSLFEAMHKAKRILVYGSGYAQARAASEFKRIFLPCQNNIYNIHGYDMGKPLADLASEQDLVVIISLSGESRAVIGLAEKLRLRQISSVSITRMKNNTLSSLCKENLYINSIPLPTDYMLDYEISTPYFILIEILYLKYQMYLTNLS